jgi:hypothetical protein
MLCRQRDNRRTTSAGTGGDAVQGPLSSSRVVCVRESCHPHDGFGSWRSHVGQATTRVRTGHRYAKNKIFRHKYIRRFVLGQWSPAMPPAVFVRWVADSSEAKPQKRHKKYQIVGISVRLVINIAHDSNRPRHCFWACSDVRLRSQTHDVAVNNMSVQETCVYSWSE